MKKWNFYSGPAILPNEVLEQAANAIEDFAGTGLSVLEVSHRSKEFVQVMEEARALVKELLQLNDSYEVLFLHGGALSQFHMVPMNLLNEGETASYFDTGTWAQGALKEARLFGNVQVACSSADKNYIYIPGSYDIASDAKYLHITSNNTIFGTQLSSSYLSTLMQHTNTPLVCDMSSDIFSRQLDFNRFDLIYAGAQKNMGPAGTTLVVVKKDILGKVNRSIPKMLDYQKHITADSMLNTPSVFAVYVSWLTLKWIKQHTIKILEETNIRKATKLYAAIDSSSLYKGTVATDSRSLMNVCFLLNDAALDDKFNKYAEEQGIIGIKGHRSVGGFRASIYNAMPERGVDTLIEVMSEFERIQ
jgi:phosphoserine aminotransferase